MYIKPTLTIITFDTEDVITTSAQDHGQTSPTLSEAIYTGLD